MLIKDQAKLDAEEILDMHWAGGFPVDPERIAFSMGMVVDRRPLATYISGMLRVEPNLTPEIFVDGRDVPQRQRFTVAHEIGHFVERTTRGELDFNFVDRRGASADYDAHEFYADEFAANLLMPEKHVRDRHDSGVSLPRMAHEFGVSLPAMKLRLRRLGLQL